MSIKRKYDFMAVDRDEFESLSSRDSQFIVNPYTGFLPREPPLDKLPEEFKIVEDLLGEMPKYLPDGSFGLLYYGKFGENVIKRLPNLIRYIEPINDTRLLQALFRDYSFLASAYLLEPCDLSYRETKTYGLGRDRLPESISVVFNAIAVKLDARPFMEYAMSYALSNYRKINDQEGLKYENLELIRRFEGSQHEAGFILVHVAMDAHTGKLVQSTLDALSAAKSNNIESLRKALLMYYDTLKKINSIMETMWTRSSGDAYNSFRTYIMGTKNQPMFPKGVVYEGVSKEPTFYRGESGANDSIIPTSDNLLKITDKLPLNPLTDILKSFRSYRPRQHNEWLNFVREASKDYELVEKAIPDPIAQIGLLVNIELVRQFRTRHWWFTKEYILKFSKHPVATGGSPIVTWLPNQLTTVLNYMKSIADAVDLQELKRILTEQNSIYLEFLAPYFPNLHDFLVYVEELKRKPSARLALLEVEVKALAKDFPIGAINP